MNPEVTSYRILNTHGLAEAYEEGKLKGNLKEMDEEDNGVVMMLKQK